MMHASMLGQTDLPTTVRDNLAGASIFASPDFLSLWSNWRRQVVYCVCFDNNTPVSAMAGVASRSLTGSTFASLPDGLYSRIFPLTEDAPIDTHKYLAQKLSERNYRRVYIYDFANNLRLDSHYTRHSISVDVIYSLKTDWEPPDSSLKSEIRKAERENVTVAEYDAQQHRTAFLALVSETSDRHERDAKYSARFYDRLAALAARDSRICWRVALHNDTVVASHIWLIDRALALHWQVCSSTRFSHLKANQLTFFHTARMLAARGVTQVSLGGTPPDAEGLRQYKARWGGSSHQYSCWTRP